MKIKKDNHYDLFKLKCDSLGIYVDQKRLISLLNQYCEGIDCEDNYGFRLCALYPKEIKHISIDLCGDLSLYELLSNLTLMGDGDCPVCGGDLKQFYSYPVYSKEYCDYDCEPEEENNDIYRCVICGEEV